ncbi:hypothetical protein, partial [Priestia aryabhattai]
VVKKYKNIKKVLIILLSIIILASIPIFNYSIYKIDKDVNHQLSVLNEKQFEKIASDSHTSKTLSANKLKNAAFEINTSGQGNDPRLGVYYVSTLNTNKEHYTVAVNVLNTSHNILKYINSDWKITQLTLLK